ncbi:MAG: hypothetical protein ACK55Z_00095 [bacterium]
MSASFMVRARAGSAACASVGSALADVARASREAQSRDTAERLELFLFMDVFPC